VSSCRFIFSRLYWWLYDGAKDVVVTLARGENSVSSCRPYSRAKGPGTSAGSFPMALSLSAEAGVQGVLGGVSRGPVGPRGPLESVALVAAAGASFGASGVGSGAPACISASRVFTLRLKAARCSAVADRGAMPSCSGGGTRRATVTACSPGML
jgi:hypothetical protein